jgi:hypothetical protein
MIASEGYVAQISDQIITIERQLSILKAERAAHILGLHRSGLPLATIGKAARLTRQRVLQIVQRYGDAHAVR